MIVQVIVLVATLMFSIFPLTDTDIWWHLACGREWVTTWTLVREPVVNVHEYFQQVVVAVYDLGGASLLVALKALLWSLVFSLFLLPCQNLLKSASRNRQVAVSSFLILSLFVFRYQLEMRPIVFSLLFLGIYWNVLPWLFSECPAAVSAKKRLAAKITGGVTLLVLQWLWCKFQGLYILGPIFAVAACATSLDLKNIQRKDLWGRLAFVLALFAMPFLHREGSLLVAYPFELLNRLLGLSPSAAIFASEIAENRSPLTLLMQGENTVTSSLMVMFTVAGAVMTAKNGLQLFKNVQGVSLLTASVLALVAERNFILFLPIFLSLLIKESFSFNSESLQKTRGLLRKMVFVGGVCLIFLVLGLWMKSLKAYGASMVSYQRVPVAAVEWMKAHPHDGRLFNDDRAGGYLALMNPADSIYIDGRFMLKTADFFEQYLEFARSPETFVAAAESQDVRRAIFPLKYYARWDSLINFLAANPATGWRLSYADDYFCVFDR